MTQRTRLAAPRTYYVGGPEGDDANDGRSPVCAFRTWQRAMEVVADLDINRMRVTVQHVDEAGAAVFTEPVTVPPLVGGGVLAIRGNTVPGGTIFDVPDGCFLLDRVGTTRVLFHDLTLRGGGSGLINVSAGALAVIGSGVVFGPATFSHLYVHDALSMAYLLNAAYTIEGGADYHLFVNGGMIFLEQTQVTLSGELAFPGGFVCAVNGGRIQTVTTTFTGASTGPRYSVTSNGVINTSLGMAGGETYFPGSWAGQRTTGGQYL